MDEWRDRQIGIPVSSLSTFIMVQPKMSNHLTYPVLALFPGLSCLQFLIAYSMQKHSILQAIKSWRQGRPGNEATLPSESSTKMEVNFR